MQGQLLLKHLPRRISGRVSTAKRELLPAEERKKRKALVPAEQLKTKKALLPAEERKKEEGTAPGKTEEEVPAGTSASKAGTANNGSCETQSVILNEAKLPDVFPLEFVFSSGAGAWRTAIVLNQDGSFNGAYLDSDMGDRGTTIRKERIIFVISADSLITSAR